MMDNFSPVAFYFQLSFKGASGKDDVFFKEISGITMEMDKEEIAEGGDNSFKYRVPKSVKFSNLVLKRGLASKNSELVIWCMNTFKGIQEDSIKTKNIVVKLLDADGTPLKSWGFSDAYPVKWSVSDINSVDNNIAIKRLEFAYAFFQ